VNDMHSDKCSTSLSSISEGQTEGAVNESEMLT